MTRSNRLRRDERRTHAEWQRGQDFGVNVRRTSMAGLNTHSGYEGNTEIAVSSMGVFGERAGFFPRSAASVENEWVMEAGAGAHKWGGRADEESEPERGFGDARELEGEVRCIGFLQFYLCYR